MSVQKSRKGHNAKRTRILNARTLLNLCRNNRSVSRADMARITGLSHPATSKIVGELVGAGYLDVKSTRRGSVGSPSTLYGIAPDAASSIGINIGRRSLQMILMALSGEILRSETVSYDVPGRAAITAQITSRIAAWTDAMTPYQRARMVGVGVCSPKYFGFSSEELSYPTSIANEWLDFDARSLIDISRNIAIFEENDANAAALAENEIGLGRSVGNFFHIFIGTFIGGGLILDGTLVRGPQGLAANYGPFPVMPSKLSSATRNSGPFESLFRRASLYVLLRHLRTGGAPVVTANDLEDLDRKWQFLVDEWRTDAAAAIMQSIVGIASIIDVEAIVIDASLPRAMIGDLVNEVRSLMRAHSARYFAIPELHPGHIGAEARAIGAAIVPFDRLIWSGMSTAGSGDEDADISSGPLPFMPADQVVAV